MSRRSTESIKSDEMKVLQYLEQHAKENLDELGKKCGFSRQKISRIVKQLEEKHAIWGYVAVTDDNSKNLKHFVLLVKRNGVPFDASFKKEIVMDKLDGYHPGIIVNHISLTHGEFDGIVCFYAADILQAKMLVQQIFNRIGKYFNKYILLEDLFPIRKGGLKNPEIQHLVEYI